MPAPMEPCAEFVGSVKFCNVVIMNLSMVLDGARQTPVWQAVHVPLFDLLQLLQFALQVSRTNGGRAVWH